MEMHRTIQVLLLTVVVMTSHSHAFSVRRHHSEGTKLDSIIQSSLPSYTTDDVKSNTDSVRQSSSVDMQEMVAAGHETAFGGIYEGKEITVGADLFEEIKEVVALAEKRNSEDDPKIDTSSGSTLSDTSSTEDINTASDLEAMAIEISTTAPSAVGSGENEAIKIESRFSLTTTLSHAAGEERSRRDACRSPTDEELYAELHSEVTVGNSLGSDTIVHSYLNNTCPRSLLSRDQRPIQTRSLCPFVTETNTDVDRYPQDILYARCACRDCINPDNNSFITRRGIDCRPVTREMVTLRRGPCVDGVYRYKRQTTQVPVACVCAKRQTI